MIQSTMGALVRNRTSTWTCINSQAYTICARRRYIHGRRRVDCRKYESDAGVLPEDFSPKVRAYNGFLDAYCQMPIIAITVNGKATAKFGMLLSV
jgi:hypothetical protein